MGPIWKGGNKNEPTLLKSAIKNSIIKAEELNCVSLALPAISSGIYGYPVEKCGIIFMKTIYGYFQKDTVTSLEEISITIIDDPTLNIFLKAFDDMLT